MQTPIKPSIVHAAARAAGIHEPLALCRVLRTAKHGWPIEHAIWTEKTQGGTINTDLYGEMPPVR